MPALVLLAAYAIGGIPFSYLFVKRGTGAGMRAAGIATLLLDIAKGYAAVRLADRLTGGNISWMSAAALAVILGHAYSVFLKFKGGNAVAVFVGAFLYLTPVPLVTTLALFIFIVAWTRYISMGSIMAAGMFPFGLWLISHPPFPVLAAAVLSGAFVVYRHRHHIQRLRAGTENVFSFRKP